QELLNREEYLPDLTIHIGEITGDYPTLGMSGKEVWRVNEDGEVRDTFRKLRYVFAMPEFLFFAKMAKQAKGKPSKQYFEHCQNLLKSIQSKVPEVPFSNVWLASKMAAKIPAGSAVHFGILNSLRTWNFY